VSQRFTLICALVLSSLTVAAPREARAQVKAAVTILRRTAVRSAPSTSANVIAFLNPATFVVTYVRAKGAFVQLLLNQIDRRQAAGSYGYIAAADIDVDSTITPVVAGTDTQARGRPAAVAQSRRDTVVAPPAVAPTPTASTPSVASAPAVASTRTSASGHYALETAEGLRPHNVTVEPTTHEGKRGVRVAISDDARRRMAAE
jgi:hypothetical protein